MVESARRLAREAAGRATLPTTSRALCRRDREAVRRAQRLGAIGVVLDPDPATSARGADLGPLDVVERIAALGAGHPEFAAQQAAVSAQVVQLLELEPEVPDGVPVACHLDDAVQPLKALRVGPV